MLRKSFQKAPPRLLSRGFLYVLTTVETAITFSVKDVNTSLCTCLCSSLGSVHVPLRNPLRSRSSPPSSGWEPEESRTMAPQTCPREAPGTCRPPPCLACISASPTSCCCFLASNLLLKSFPSYRNPPSIARSPQPPASAWQLLKAKSPLTPSIANHLPPLNSRPNSHSTLHQGHWQRPDCYSVPQLCPHL